MNPLKPIIDSNGYAMLDGGLSTQLERLGAKLEGELWTSRVLIDQPGLVSQAHRAFLEAGADIIATATYQASIKGFIRSGLAPDEAARLMRGAVGLAVEARDEFWSDRKNRAGRQRPLVAVSLGPYGACLHDGSEYSGDYGLGKEELIEFHKPRVALLEAAGADLFAFETFPSLLEAQAVFELLEDFPEIHAWISFSCRDETHVAHGEPFAECVRQAGEQPRIVAVGVNCLPPENVPSLLASAHGTNLPLAAYPNSGEHWDAGAQQWRGQVVGTMDVGAWHHLGARLIGGCCRTTADDIRTMRSYLEAALR
jgi:homocysteine S-methyltransferase